MAMQMLTGRFSKLTSERRYQACLVLKSIIKPDMPERYLWFAVLERAIMDIDRKDIHNSGYFFKQEGLAMISDVLNTYPEIIIRVLNRFEIWPSQQSKAA